MVTIPELGAPPKLITYAPAQLAELAGQSSAVARYLVLIREKATSLEMELRRDRHQAWLEAVAASYFQTTSTSEICRYWTEAADAILRRAWVACGLDTEQAALLALGKLGASELNLSSDVDLLAVATPDSQTGVEKKLRAFRKLLMDVTDFGFCFRIDFDLRPGGASGALVTTPSQFQDHYWARGEAWEKMALVRLRPIVGNEDLLQVVQEHARRFSFRKFLDFNLLDDLQQVRARIHSEGFEARAGQIHIKLGRGGIRDIEIFVNALQVLHGGKITRLQTRSTEKAFEQIQLLHILSNEEIDFLQQAYWDFRRWENMLQAIDDRQTHFLHWPAGWKGQGWPTMEVVRERMRRVDAIVENLLGPANATVAIEIPTEADQPAWLQSLGFSETSVLTVWPQLQQASSLAQKTDRDERARRRFLFRLIEELAASPNDKDLGLSLSHDFLKAIRAKAAFFALLNREPKLVRDLARLFSFSPYLGSLFTSRPEMIDNFVLNVDEPFSRDFETLLDEMAGRKFLSEMMAAIRFLSDLQTAPLMSALTLTADTLTSHLLARLTEEFGSQPMDLLCLGKWGGHELGLKSDLDFIFLTDQPPTEKEHKVARRFVSRLTDPHRGGSLYAIDLRLRPSGKAGPILTTPDQLRSFLTKSAEIWERQAYLRARSLFSGTFPVEAIWARPVAAEELNKLADIRRRLLKPLDPDKVDLKYTPGGLVDVELAAQTAMLMNRPPKISTNTRDVLRILKWPEEVICNYDRLRQLQQLLLLAGSLKSNELGPKQEGVIRCSRLLELHPSQLMSEIMTSLNENEKILKEIDPRQREPIKNS